MTAAHGTPGAVIGLAKKKRRFGLDTLLRVVTNPVGAIFGTIFVVIVIAATFAPWIAPNDPISTSIDVFKSPSLATPAGTDELGRDQLSRLIYGARPALTIGILAVILAVSTGSILGLLSGYSAPGMFDLIVQRYVDGIGAIPGIILILAIISVLGPSLRNAVIAIAFLLAASISRVVRSAAMSVKQEVYIEAAHALGASTTRIMFRHVFPNVLAPILILVSTTMGTAVLIDASLSFLGLGTQPPNPSWGLMLATSGRRHMETAPWLAIFPGVCITITVLTFNMVGDVIRDVLDPRLRGSR